MSRGKNRSKTPSSGGAKVFALLAGLLGRADCRVIQIDSGIYGVS